MSDTTMQYIVDAPNQREVMGGHKWEVVTEDGVQTVEGYVISDDPEAYKGFEGGEVIWEGPASDATHIEQIEGILSRDASDYGPCFAGC